MSRARREPPSQPAALCACGAPSLLPCHVCGVPLCADHGLTRLLVTHCHKCASAEGGTFFTHREILMQLGARQRGEPRARPVAPRIDASGWATLEAALAKKQGGD